MQKKILKLKLKKPPKNNYPEKKTKKNNKHKFW